MKLKQKRNNPFKKVAIGDEYYFTNEFGDIGGYTQTNDRNDTTLFNNSNYFNYGKAEIRFVKGRLKFTDENGKDYASALFPSMVVVYNPK